MKDKLEVGHFIRTIKGIGRIEEITEDKTEIYFNCDTGLTISFIKKDFTQEEMAQYYKHSDSIIDLIEVGDYVNGDLVLFAGATTWDNDGNVLDKQVYINHNGYDLWLREEYIKSIVTKEMYSSVEYRVEAD